MSMAHLDPDLDSLLPSSLWSRRNFVQGAAAGGFAAAVLPVAASTIRTDAEGLEVGRVSIAVGKENVPAYAARPKHMTPGTRLPVVLVVSEIFGVHEHIADVTRRLAKQGYLAVAPELFVRQGDPSGYTEIGKLIAELISKVPDEQVLSDLDATRAWAVGQGGDERRVGITGFCWGGRITWLYAAHAPVQAGVAWYGRLIGDSTPITPRHPVDITPRLQAPVLGLYGGQDSGIPIDTVERMKQALASGSTAAKASQFVIYPDAPHAFHADYRPSYRADAARDGWQRCLGWLGERLKT